MGALTLLYGLLAIVLIIMNRPEELTAFLEGKAGRLFFILAMIWALAASLGMTCGGIGMLVNKKWGLVIAFVSAWLVSIGIGTVVVIGLRVQVQQPDFLQWILGRVAYAMIPLLVAVWVHRVMKRGRMKLGIRDFEGPIDEVATDVTKEHE